MKSREELGKELYKYEIILVLQGELFYFQLRFIQPYGFRRDKIN